MLLQISDQACSITWFSDVIIEAFFFFFIFHNNFSTLKINYFLELTFQCKYLSYLRIGQLGNDGKKNGSEVSRRVVVNFSKRLKKFYCFKVNFFK